MEKNSNTSNLDDLLSKYISVWLWSILFGANTGVLVSFYIRQELQGWGSTALTLSIILCTGAVFLVLSYVNLYFYFKRFIIPVFLEGKIIDSLKYRKKTSSYLLLSFNCFVASLFLGILAELIKTIISALF